MLPNCKAEQTSNQLKPSWDRRQHGLLCKKDPVPASAAAANNHPKISSESVRFKPLKSRKSLKVAKALVQPSMSKPPAAMAPSRPPGDFD